MKGNIMTISEKNVRDEVQEMKNRLIEEVKVGLYDDMFPNAWELNNEEIWQEIECYNLDGIENLIYDAGFIAGLEMVLNYLQEK